MIVIILLVNSFAWGDSTPQTIIDGPVRMEVSVSRTETAIAVPVTMTVQIESPKTTKLQPPAIEASFGDFQVVDQTAVGPLPVDGDPNRTIHRYLYQLESLQSGTLVVAPIHFGYQIADAPMAAAYSHIDTNQNRSGTLVSRPIQIDVASSLAPDADLTDVRPLKPMVVLPEKRPTDLRWWGLGLVIGPAILAAFLWRRRRPRPADKLAMAQIHRIESEVANRQISGDQGAQSLAVALRRFIQDRHAIPATAMATSELVTAVGELGWPQDQVAILKSFLGSIDQRRFAASRLGADTIDADANDGPSGQDRFAGQCQTVRQIVRSVSIQNVPAVSRSSESRSFRSPSSGSRSSQSPSTGPSSNSEAE
ncbi:protein BatD [Rubripirellula lacrimiformis]|uniref:protein BatD n=1 Tax=Rubripirellula lacrimiformis TaxID=1930273 RepID=UPI0011A41642|nr:protein BatD [Rubripirellula lacrimiformis]